MAAKPINITDDEFQEKVLNADGAVLVDFWAPWCGPCKMVAPALEELAAEHEGKLTVAKVNVDDHNRNAGQLGVQGIPTLILFVDGEEKDRIVGALPKAALAKRLEGAIPAAAS